jgi:hypothetical protein
MGVRTLLQWQRAIVPVGDSSRRNRRKQGKKAVDEGWKVYEAFLRERTHSQKLMPSQMYFPG